MVVSSDNKTKSFVTLGARVNHNLAIAQQFFTPSTFFETFLHPISAQAQDFKPQCSKISRKFHIPNCPWKRVHALYDSNPLRYQ